MGNCAVAAESIERPVRAVLRAADLRSFGEQSRGLGLASAAQRLAAPTLRGAERSLACVGLVGRAGWPGQAGECTLGCRQS